MIRVVCAFMAGLAMSAPAIAEEALLAHMQARLSEITEMAQAGLPDLGRRIAGSHCDHARRDLELAFRYIRTGAIDISYAVETEHRNTGSQGVVAYLGRRPDFQAHGPTPWVEAATVARVQQVCEDLTEQLVQPTGG